MSTEVSCNGMTYRVRDEWELPFPGLNESEFDRRCDELAYYAEIDELDNFDRQENVRDR